MQIIRSSADEPADAEENPISGPRGVPVTEGMSTCQEVNQSFGKYSRKGWYPSNGFLHTKSSTYNLVSSPATY